MHKSLPVWFRALNERFRRVRVTCGDWQRVLSKSVTTRHGISAVFLDPPYGKKTGRRQKIYCHDSSTLAADVRNWAVAHGDDPQFRIALCGHEGEHDMPKTWDCLHWKGARGFAKLSQNKNRERERIWFSPHCLGG